MIRDNECYIMSKKQKPKRSKQYNLQSRKLKHVEVLSDRIILAGVSGIPAGVYIMNDELEDVNLTKSQVLALNATRRDWSFCMCVAGRYKNGNVWVSYEVFDTPCAMTSVQASPLVTKVLDALFYHLDERTRLCQWWVAKPVKHYHFSAEDVITPAYKADIFHHFISKNEKMAGVEHGNHPPSGITIEEFKVWWDKNHSPRSQLQGLWGE